MTESPYVGLRPYTDREASLFFGRERERRIVSSNLVASRLTLAYGPSGVGKSSILNAAVVPHLRALSADEADGGTPGYAVVVFNAWRDEPVAGLIASLASAVGSTIAELPDTTDPATPLSRVLRAWTETSGTDLLLVLDQFEEYFLYHGGRDGQDRFAREFSEAVNDPSLRVNFLISLREDALAGLDLFKGRIPRLFGNYLRIGYLDGDGAREAVRGPVGEYNRRHPDAPMEVEPALVDAVLEQVQAGKVVVGRAGAGTVDQPTATSSGRVETSHLQIVMARLWDEETSTGSSVLRVVTLERLGGAAEIVRSHLDRELALFSDAEQHVVAAAFEHLVTPSGTKIAHSAPDLAVLAGVDGADLAAVLGRLSSGTSRVLRPVEPAPGGTDVRYEIFHDVLAAAVLDWRARYVQQKESAAAEEELRRQRRRAEERARAARRKARNVSIFSLVTALLVVTLVVAVTARRQRELASSRQQAAEALSYLLVDPVRSVRGAVAALDTAHTQEAETALRQARAGVRVRSVLTGHSDWINTVVFDPQGTSVVTAGNDRTARLWDIATGRERAVLRGHTQLVAKATFDPAGRRIVTASADGTARLWDASTGAQLRILGPEPAPSGGVRSSGQGSPVVTAVFGPAGATVVSAGDDGIVRLWDAGSGRQLRELRGHSGLVTSARFDTTGSRLLTADSDGTVRVWDVGTGAELARLDRHRARVASAVFSPDGGLVATAGTEGAAFLWRWQAGVTVELSGHTGPLHDAEFDRSGAHVVTAGDNVARVWEAATGSILAELRGHAGPVTAAVFSADGRQVSTASQDGSARIWDVATEASLVELRGHAEIVWGLAVSPSDPRMVATASSDGTARVWELPDQLALAHPAPVETAELSQDGRTVVTSETGTAHLWDATTGAAGAELSGHDGPVSASFSPDGNLVVTVDQKRARVWDLRAGGKVIASTAEVQAGLARFTPSGDDLVVSDVDGTLYLWSWNTSDPLRRLSGFRGAVQDTDLHLSADGSRAVTAGTDRTARIWELATGRELATLRAHDGILYSARFSPDGRSVVTSSADGTARIWDAATGAQGRTLVAEQPLRTATFDPTGARVAAGAVDGSVRIWQARTGRTLSVLSRHTSAVNVVAFSPAAGGSSAPATTGLPRSTPAPRAGSWPPSVRRREASSPGFRRQVPASCPDGAWPGVTVTTRRVSTLGSWTAAPCMTPRCSRSSRIRRPSTSPSTRFTCVNLGSGNVRGSRSGSTSTARPTAPGSGWQPGRRVRALGGQVTDARSASSRGKTGQQDPHVGRGGDHLQAQ